jgi:predicted DNA-binding protein
MKERLVKQVKIRMTLVLWQALVDIARRESRSLSGVVRLACEEFVARHNERKENTDFLDT